MKFGQNCFVPKHFRGWYAYGFTIQRGENQKMTLFYLFIPFVLNDWRARFGPQAVVVHISCICLVFIKLLLRLLYYDVKVF